jgi:hypothetical protein
VDKTWNNIADGPDCEAAGLSVEFTSDVDAFVL